MNEVFESCFKNTSNNVKSSNGIGGLEAKSDVRRKPMRDITLHKTPTSRGKDDQSPSALKSVKFDKKKYIYFQYKRIESKIIIFRHSFLQMVETSVICSI